jgi:hypothetical protein
MSLELDRLGEDLVLLDREVAQAIITDPAVARLITITGINVVVAAGLVAAIGDIRRFTSPQKLVSYVGLNPRVRQWDCQGFRVRAMKMGTKDPCHGTTQSADHRGRTPGPAPGWSRPAVRPGQGRAR